MLKYFIIYLMFADMSHANHKPKDWWEQTIFYQIYPRSFMDSNADGIGDLRGITSKLKYLADTGIEAAWLSPIFQSPMVDFGYDISSFTTIHREYGTMEDFDDLIVEARRVGVKIILDFVPNHTSDQCDWFLKSVNREAGYENWYIWHDGRIDENGQALPPNNWPSVFYGPAWTWNDKRKQFYLHQFTKEQPDLNFRNYDVIVEMENVLKFWLEKGVDGFRIDAVNHLFEAEDFADEPLTGIDSDPYSYGYTHHYNTKDLIESAEMIYKWRKLLDDWKNVYGGDTRIIMTEAYANITSTVEFYGTDQHDGAHIPFNFLLLTELNDRSDARDFLFVISKWLCYLPPDKTANWVLGNHDKSRVATRYGGERIDAMNMLVMSLPGVAITYNGEEIGMYDNGEISWEDTQDPAGRNTNKDVYMKFSRDPVRTPFQWDDTLNSGFSNASKTWLPIPENYQTNNLKVQQSAERSHYKVYKQLANLRKHKTMQYGHFHPIAINKYVLAYTRELNDDDAIFVVVINLNKTPQVINLKVFDSLPENLIVVVAGVHSTYRTGMIVRRELIVLGKYDSIVLSSIKILQPKHYLLQFLEPIVTTIASANRYVNLLGNVCTIMAGIYIFRNFNRTK